MSDSAFKTALYPAYTSQQLAAFAATAAPETAVKMIDEIARRKAVAFGDLRRATDGKRLRARRA